LHSNRLRVRDLTNQRQFDLEPVLSIGGDQTVVAVGRPIPASAVKTYAPFASPEALAADTRIAELILMFVYSKLGPSKFVSLHPASCWR
jgi:hypothetical protein